MRLKRVIISAVCAILAPIGMDFFLRLAAHSPRSLFFSLRWLWADPRGHQFALMLGFGYGLACAIGASAGWVFSAPEDDALDQERRAIGQAVIDEALQRVKADVPLSAAAESSALARFWQRFERLFGKRA